MSRFRNLKQPTLTFALAAVIALPVYNATAADETGKAVVAEVNGEPITAKSLELYARMRTQDGTHPLSDEQRKAMVDELINRELVYQDAMSKDLQKSPEVQAEVEEQTRNILTSYRIQGLLEKNPPTEEQMRKVYQEQVVARASKEYKARHILTKTEDEAKAIIKELKKGANFAELAKSKSTGPSAKEGGDLGWFAPNQMVKPFADAVMNMKPGKFSRTPVQTQFGWHVILLEDVRDVAPPSFEQVKGQIEAVVQNQIISDYLQGLKAKAKIEVK